MIGWNCFLCRAIVLQPCQELSSRTMQLFSIKQNSWKMLFPLQPANWSGGNKKNDATRSLSPPFQLILVSLSSGGLLPQAGSPSWRATPRDPAPGSGAHGASRRALGGSARALCSVWRARRVGSWKGYTAVPKHLDEVSWPSVWESKSSLSPSSCVPQTRPAELVHHQDLICAKTSSVLQTTSPINPADFTASLSKCQSVIKPDM